MRRGIHGMRGALLAVIVSAMVLPAMGEPVPSYNLDLSSAVGTALERNPSVQSAVDGESAARARLGGAVALDALRVNLNTGYTYVSESTLFGGMTVLDKNTNMNSVSATKPIYTGGAAEAARDGARWEVTAAGKQTQASKEAIALAVAEVYMRALEARDNLRVADDAISYLQANLDAATKMMAAGVAPKSDVYRAETDLASAKERRIQIETAYKSQLAALRDLLGLEPSAEITISDALPELPTPGSGASTDRPEVLAMRAAVKAAEAQVRRAEAAAKPTVSVSADYLNIGAGAEFPRRSNTFSIGIGASMPLIDGGAAKAGVAEAKASLKRAESALRAVESRVQLEREQAQLGLESANARVASADARLKSARESARALRVSYAEGIAPITDVLGARAALTEAESAGISSGYDRFLAQVRILKTEGMILKLAETHDK